MLDWVLDRQRATLLVAVAHARADGGALHRRSRRASSRCRTPARSRASRRRRRSISFAAMAERQQALAQVVLEDPAVESLSSFIGVDGTNATLNSGRMLINLKPRGERDASAIDVIRRLQPKLAEGRGHHALHAAGAGPDDRGPRQPHAVPVHARGRRRRRARRLGAAARRAPAAAAAARRRRERPAGPGPAGLRRDRPRHRGPPRHHAGGDRQRALQRVRPAPGLDDLHADEPVPRGARGEARVPARARRRSTTSTCTASGQPAQQVPLSSIARVDRAAGAARRSTTSASSRRRRSRSTSRRGASLGDAVEAIEAARARARRCRPACRPTSRARRSRSAPRSPTSCC